MHVITFCSDDTVEIFERVYAKNIYIYILLKTKIFCTLLFLKIFKGRVILIGMRLHIYNLY